MSEHIPPMLMRAVIFDLDGTLVDSERDIMASVLVALRDQGVSHLTLPDLEGFRGFPLVEIYTALVAGGDGRRWNRFAHIYRAHYCDHCVDHTRPYPGVVETLEQLSGLPLAVATAKPTWNAIDLLERLGLAHHFALVQGSERLPSKPDPAVLLRTAGRLGIPPGEIAVVGDTDRDIQAAQAARMRVFAAGWGNFGRDRLLALRPDAILDRPEDLLGVLAA